MKDLTKKSDEYLVEKREELIDKLTPNQMADDMLLLLEIERELTLREE